MTSPALTHYAAQARIAELEEALQGLKTIVELAVTRPDGLQYVYLETRFRTFVHVADALKKADEVLAASKGA